MKNLAIGILVGFLVSCSHTQRSPSSTYYVKGTSAVKLMKALEGSVLKYSGYNMSKAYYETVKGQCILSNDDKKAKLWCNDKLIATKSEASEIVEALKGSALIYSDFNMGKAYFDIQGGVMCEFTDGKSDGGVKHASFSCN